MRISQHVTHAIDDAQAGKPDSALMHACIAVDATAKRMYAEEKRVGARFVRCIREYYWIVEPMLGAGLNLADTTFANVPLRISKTPDLAQIIYEIYRCAHAHGEEIPAEFQVVPAAGDRAQWLLAKGQVHPPDTLAWALLGIVVFSRTNQSEKTTGTYFLSLEGREFPIADWWGREDDFRPIAEKHNSVRVRLDGLAGLVDRIEAVAGS